MIKRYTANSSQYDISLTLQDGRTIVLNFEGKDILNKVRFIDVTDSEIQELLDNHPSNGIYFEYSNEFHWTKDLSEKELVDVSVVPYSILSEQGAVQLKPINFGSLKESKHYLLSEHSIPFRNTGNLDYATEEFRKLGYKLEIN